MMTSTMNKATLITLALGIAFALALIAVRPDPIANASVPMGGEYQGTTTVTGSYAAEQLLETGNGALGSVVITGAATGVINIYDATTSDITKRKASMSTSSILLATFPASAAAGTYTFDRVLFNGLYTSVIGTMPTTTITFR